MATARPRKRPSTKRTKAATDVPVTQDAQASVGGIRWLSPEEGRQYFEAEVRKRLGISGDEFLRRWDAGEYDTAFEDPAQHASLVHLWMLSSLAR